jgi:hypothetical protein
MSALIGALRRSSAASSSNASLSSMASNLGPESNEIFTTPPPGYGPKKKIVHTKEQEEKVRSIGY